MAKKKRKRTLELLAEVDFEVTLVEPVIKLKKGDDEGEAQYDAECVVLDKIDKAIGGQTPAARKLKQAFADLAYEVSKAQGTGKVKITHTAVHHR